MIDPRAEISVDRSEDRASNPSSQSNDTEQSAYSYSALYEDVEVGCVGRLSAEILKEPKPPTCMNHRKMNSSTKESLWNIEHGRRSLHPVIVLKVVRSHVYPFFIYAKVR
jgi:hypothetical protein